MSEITFFVPLPPPELRSNSRAHYRTKTAAKQVYSREVWTWFKLADQRLAIDAILDLPWQRARVTYTWRYAGVAPDKQNLGANLKALTDILCMAPNNGLQANRTTYLGLVEDDKGVDPVYQLEHVKRRAAQGVSVKIEKL